MSLSNVYEKTTIKKIRTGDILFFSNNTPTGLTLRTFTSTLWSHTGIAVRIIERKGKKFPKISLTKKGKLCVMEINSLVRYDNWKKKYNAGFGFSDIDYVLKNQTLAATRPLKKDLRIKLLAKRTTKFVKKFGHAKFPLYFKPFLGAWLGYPTDKLGIRKPENLLVFDDDNDIEMFCSEMMAYYYIYTMIPICSVVRGKKITKLPLQYILGNNCPHRPDIIAPKHFEPHNSEDSELFLNSIRVYHRNKDNIFKALMFPTIAGLVLGVVIWSSMPGNSWAEMANL